MVIRATFRISAERLNFLDLTRGIYTRGMSTTFRQVPETMNLLIKSGDEVDVDVEFGASLSGYTVSSQLYSLVDFREIYGIPTSIADPVVGRVRLLLDEENTSEIPSGAYGWSLKWVAPGGVTRTVLSGIAEVIR